LIFAGENYELEPIMNINKSASGRKYLQFSPINSTTYVESNPNYCLEILLAVRAHPYQDFCFTDITGPFSPYVLSTKLLQLMAIQSVLTVF